MDKNDRKYIRYKLFPYTYDVLLHTPKGVLRAGIHDIGQGGAGLLMDDTLAIGQKAELIVTINGQTHKLKGVVSWLNSMEESYTFRSGLSFESSEHDKALKLIESLATT